MSIQVKGLLIAAAFVLAFLSLYTADGKFAASDLDNQESIHALQVQVVDTTK